MGSFKKIANIILFFITSLLIILISNRFAPELYFLWEFENQVNYIAKQQSIRDKDIHKVINELFKSLTLTCSENDRRLLQSPQYHSRYILLTGVITASKEVCSSLGKRLSLPLHEFIGEPQNSRSAFFLKVSDFDDSLQKLVISYNNNQAIFFVVLSSGSFYRLQEKFCENCFYMELSLPNGAVLEIGEPSIKHEDKVYKHKFSIANHELNMTIFAGHKFRHITSGNLYELGYQFASIIIILIFIIICMIFFKRATMVGKIEHAINHRAFIPYYQPILNVESNKVVGVEVLIRWQVNGEWLSPDKFISYAEDNGLIIPITKVLLDKVLIDIQYFPDDIWLSINVCAKHFDGRQLFELLSDVTPEVAKRISLEITERHPISHINDAAIKINELQKKGFSFKLDDFGTGYGGVAYLQLLGVRSIKIDKMFIKTIDNIDVNEGVLESIIAFGIESGYEMIAEGVETIEQALFLKQRGIILHQGYFYSKPKPLHLFLEHYYFE